MAEVISRIARESVVDEDDDSSVSLKGVTDQISNIVFQGFTSLVSRFK